MANTQTVRTFRVSFPVSQWEYGFVETTNRAEANALAKFQMGKVYELLEGRFMFLGGYFIDDSKTYEYYCVNECKGEFPIVWKKNNALEEEMMAYRKEPERYTEFHPFKGATNMTSNKEGAFGFSFNRFDLGLN